MHPIAHLRYNGWHLNKVIMHVHVQIMLLLQHHHHHHHGLALIYCLKACKWELFQPIGSFLLNDGEYHINRIKCTSCCGELFSYWVGSMCLLTSRTPTSNPTRSQINRSTGLISLLGPERDHECHLKMITGGEHLLYRLSMYNSVIKFISVTNQVGCKIFR